ncbi:hypothetical protein [Streptomyces sp. NPDC005385]|uniref:hypothetical protein n=1 Tax=Streptomyces sp. NPDC005385 TaxID=3157039 RepID=UPI0033AD83F2
MSFTSQPPFVVGDLTGDGDAGAKSDQPIVFTIHQKRTVAPQPRALSLTVRDGPPVEDPPERQDVHSQDLKVVLDVASFAIDLGKHQLARFLFGQHRLMMASRLHASAGRLLG